ncbi:hypothetical protein [Streptomyces sp. NPDC088115]
MPVMLDYRESLTAPCVLYMNDTVWVQVASNSGEFLAFLYGDESG